MTITLTTFAWVPPFAEGYVRDLPVRWALTEAGLDYDVDHVDHETKRSPAYLARQPFGQVPAYRDGEVEMFESGAIVLHIARSSAALMPSDPARRAMAESWALAALNTIEPVGREFEQAHIFHKDEPWAAARLPQIEDMLDDRLGRLAERLGTSEWLDGEFTAGDLMMVTVLRNVVESSAFLKLRALADYVGRGEARPAFQAALAAQIETFRRNAPPNGAS